MRVMWWLIICETQSNTMREKVDGTKSKLCRSDYWNAYAYSPLYLVHP